MLRRILTASVLLAGMLPLLTPSASAAPSGGCPYPPNRPKLAIAVAPTTIRAGQLADVFGSFKQNNCGIHNGNIHVQHRALVNGKPSGSWSTFVISTTDSNGLWAAAYSPSKNQQMRAFFQASGRYQTTYSSILPFNVRTKLTFNSKSLAGCQVRLTGRTVPVKANRRIFIQNRGPAGHFKGWTTMWETRTNSKGVYSTTHNLACGSTHNLAAYIAHDAVNLASRSRTIFGIKAATVAP